MMFAHKKSPILVKVCRKYFCRGNICSKNRQISALHLQCYASSNSTSEKTVSSILNGQVLINNDSSASYHTSSQNYNGTTYSAEEADKFRPLATEWWKPNGDFKALHSMNKLRVALIRDGLLETGAAEASLREGPKPLQGLRILDVGCGGGILSEPLARLGAVVTGLDAVQEGIDVATRHTASDRKIADKIMYICGTLEDHIEKLEQPYDAVVASEVIEHVESVNVFLDGCDRALRPGGSLFITTLNKTPQSYLGAIVAAEYLLRIVPRGTHDWNKFLPPQELEKLLDQRGMRTHLQHGMFYLPLTDTWCWIRDTSINYALHAIKAS